MTINERHDIIMRELNTKGQVGVTELSTLLNVSEVTIRKDLTMLEQNNLLYRAHGKAIKISPYINDRDVNVKEQQYPNEKIAIGKCAIKLIEPNDSIIIASGTTVQYFAREIKLDESSGRLTVITSALNVASTLTQPQHRGYPIGRYRARQFTIGRRLRHRAYAGEFHRQQAVYGC